MQQLSLNSNFRMKSSPYHCLSTLKSLSVSEPLLLSLVIQNSLPSNARANCRCSSSAHLKSSILCAINRRKRSGFSRSGKLAIESAIFIASKLKILPEPLEALIKEFGGGNGGGIGGFGRGPGWGGFEGWRRRRRKAYWFVSVLAICAIGLWLIMRTEYDIDVIFACAGMALFGVSVIGLKKGVIEWALGFCSGAALFGYLLKREDFLRWLRQCEVLNLGRRRKRRAFGK